ncbi:MAG: spore coat protein CotJB [Ruminococcus sp.]|uniref:spore coat protein CotJB n=1 Tax=Ruminococcus sp. TaxID=41978 RepID=UPI0025DDFDED|nr:spore coat protein CotJB [Ruminococcus sp.]MCR5599638.1 spore coat protein CotJB [Ruminococcus sp.]
MNERKMLLNKIKKYDFALKELVLFLDTHTECRSALAMFKKYKELRSSAVEEYSRKFGPLTPEQNNDMRHWSWTDDPWPWERR